MCINTMVGEHRELGKNGSKRQEEIPFIPTKNDTDKRKTRAVEDRHKLMLMTA
jgi:hypothetical protein